MHEMQIGAGWFGLIQHLNEIPGQARNDGGFLFTSPLPRHCGEAAGRRSSLICPITDCFALLAMTAGLFYPLRQ